ncbi:hypothetical protein NO559_16785 [Dasania sp. GY-MA-18]|uniref:Uncharacterized protein n=2 Tax=Dasania phycosphaerae TaxID=2950436 RepID=A0A9J6RRA1_9GAMM|nr:MULTISPECIES: hypothetical protein [Dasania]MCR8924432.1 hypothetical protein [Dasania sp. GY-MA-18]MCZ0867107.1 hypothetical protein [Dasania phycosphaerae]MCZ0870559.1 hypothetical protein [Dasania phycosphaerae]
MQVLNKKQAADRRIGPKAHNCKHSKFWRVKMKNVAVLAVIVGLLGGTTAVAETGVSKGSTMILAMNSITANNQWLASKAVSVDTDAIAKKVELQVSKSLEDISVALDKQLEEKFAKEFANDKR